VAGNSPNANYWQAWLAVLVLVIVASGCVAGKRARDRATVEARDEFPLIEAALDAFAEKSGGFPDKLTELDLDADIITPSDDRFDYRYESRPDYSGGPDCRYELRLTTPSSMSSTVRLLAADRVICDPDDRERVLAIAQAAVVEAEQEFPVIKEALHAHFAEHGFLPLTLDALELDAEATTVGQEYGRYHFRVRDHRRNNFTIDGKPRPQREFDLTRTCGYELRLDLPISIGERTPALSIDYCPPLE